MMSKTVELAVEGMSCQHCVKHVTNTLEELPGIGEVQVSLTNGKVSFETTEATSLEQVKAALDDAGYAVVE